MNLTMENRKPTWTAGLVVAWVVPDRGEEGAAAEPGRPSFQAALLGNAVMHPDCAAVPDVM
ncbi:MAG: hypothetical protein LBB68_02660 [Treponema sp.]|jgi:hypothetical protein|nr:hypothetical protein [Treponema sp.]